AAGVQTSWSGLSCSKAKPLDASPRPTDSRNAVQTQVCAVRQWTDPWDRYVNLGVRVVCRGGGQHLHSSFLRHCLCTAPVRAILLRLLGRLQGGAGAPWRRLGFLDVYLDGLDHFVCDGLWLPRYQLYADDITLFSDDHGELVATRSRIEA